MPPKAPLLLLALAVLAFPLTSHAEPAPTKVATAPSSTRLDGALEARRVKMVAALPAGVRAKLDAPIQEVVRRAQPPATTTEKGKATDLVAVARGAVAALGGLDGQDIESLVAIVMMEAARSAEQDLRTLLADIQAANKKRAAQRAALAALQASRATTKGCPSLSCLDTLAPSSEYARSDLDALKQWLAGIAEQKREASLNEVSASQILRLQTFMERRAKLEEMLSNLVRKATDASSAIAQNLK